ncbi:uncharacterized protein EI90DRAFT_3151761 [Cantharellus anzutake]|uniref:uncharacterized protein n=1 Tax=Cantharellus anzutake TaxID=1750568 RepID=UPI0019043821|nr:uncharacterized protein EI90DRAFT_3151761 [Cantharellus anzutake]KAF8337889.1 hypothetical protein EI90DRAFT_3151761 [Cantharellus anzutake]
MSFYAGHRSRRGIAISAPLTPLKRLEQLEGLVDEFNIEPLTLDVTPTLLTRDANARQDRRSALAEARKQVEAQLARLNRITDKIRQKRALLNQRRAALANANSPVEAIPPEVLGIIFKYATSYDPPFGPVHPPLSLSHVSSYWRRVAFQHATLWTRIMVGTFQNRSGLLKEWMHRSGEAPLSVVVNEALDWRAMSSLFIPKFVPRFRSLEVQGGYDMTTSGSRFETMKFPSLESLTMVGAPIISMSGISFDNWTLPKLHSLDLAYLKLRDPGYKFGGQLRSLALRGFNYDVESIRIILDRCPNLEHLSIGGLEFGPIVQHFGPEASAWESCTLENLRSLELQCCPADTWEYFAKCVKVPNLESLSMTLGRSTTDIHWNPAVIDAADLVFNSTTLPNFKKLSIDGEEGAVCRLLERVTSAILLDGSPAPIRPPGLEVLHLFDLKYNIKMPTSTSLTRLVQQYIEMLWEQAPTTPTGRFAVPRLVVPRELLGELFEWYKGRVEVLELLRAPC